MITYIINNIIVITVTIYQQEINKVINSIFANSWKLWCSSNKYIASIFGSYALI